MKVIIAEKPSVARDIAAIVGATSRKDGYLEGNNYAVTWAFGHLIGLAMPEEYGIKGFQKENLPILPEDFKLIPRHIKEGKEYKPDPRAMKQLKVIRELFNKSERIIVATDAGREGELIFRYIYNYLSCSKPFDRLWISSLTDQAIRGGLENLRPGTQYDTLYLSAKARSQADWLVGINASQALSISAGSGVWSLGRVQTPTLAMICSRYLENKDFVPQKYWQHKLNLSKDGNVLTPVSEDKYNDRIDADKVTQDISQNGIATVKSIEKKTVKQEPPLLYDLTALQKEANGKHSFSADKTLSIAQKLYEGKLITYPRTGSRYLSEDVFETVPELLSGFNEHTLYGESVKRLNDLNKRSINDAKVTDHHAIIVTGNKPGSLPGDEKLIFEMILCRMLEAFSTTCIKEQTTVRFEVQEKIFLVKGAIINQIGWRSVSGVMADENEKDENSTLPPLNEGDRWNVDSTDTLEKQTKPRPLHTEASLLSVMEIPCQREQSRTRSDVASAAGIGQSQTCGKELADEAEREALKESGIGTPATRAAIIETLFSREYIVRDKKALVPTNKGLVVYLAVKDKKIADVAMTGSWENALNKIATGEMNAADFHKGIEVYAGQITAELLTMHLEHKDEKAGYPCPKCGKERVVLYPKVAKCRDEDCGYVIFRNKSGKDLSDKHLIDLLTKGKTSLIKGFKSKAEKTFDAFLRLDDTLKPVFEFDNTGKKKGGKG
ncbi:DNA topoisomerase III [Dysgonomonas sp. GY75]|uniref:type IA DNA topoisomerase n=1 Tax=Dysgonomonas sp. GY75 TaxID=2780419 RepID=UPI00188349F7|nr:type IA DNA topoisomerase [Dysgonomonas sp. GY75]MBF0647866.1 DNA topoisomerase III [Dysgonomonas sp. GY75]